MARGRYLALLWPLCFGLDAEERSDACALVGDQQDLDVAVVGLGPNGLRTLACLSSHPGLRVVGFERGLVGSTVRKWHPGSVTQSALDDDFGLAVGGVPLAPYCRAKSRGRRVTGDNSCSCTKEEYARYLEDVVPKLGLRVRNREEVVSIRPRATKDGFKVLTRRRTEPPNGTVAGEIADDAAAPVCTSMARFVVLALGVASEPRKLSIPGGLKALLPWQLEEAERYHGSRVAVVGSGNSALEVAIDLCHHGAKQVLLFHRWSDLQGVVGQLRAKSGTMLSPLPRLNHNGIRALVDLAIEEETLSTWLRRRYALSEDVWFDEMHWYQQYIEWAFHELRRCGAAGVLAACSPCEVTTLNGTHLIFRDGSDEGGAAAEGAAPIDIVVAALGGRTDERLLDAMKFPVGPVDARIGETSIPGIFAVGFDVPGAPQHHTENSTYQNWLAWGNAAAQATCLAVKDRYSGIADAAAVQHARGRTQRLEL